MAKSFFVCVCVKILLWILWLVLAIGRIVTGVYMLSSISSCFDWLQRKEGEAPVWLVAAKGGGGPCFDWLQRKEGEVPVLIGCSKRRRGHFLVQNRCSMCPFSCSTYHCKKIAGHFNARYGHNTPLTALHVVAIQAFKCSDRLTRVNRESDNLLCVCFVFKLMAMFSDCAEKPLYQ